MYWWNDIGITLKLQQFLVKVIPFPYEEIHCLKALALSAQVERPLTPLYGHLCLSREWFIIILFSAM